MMQAVIFDMDGVLIDSEPLWQEAEIKVFGSVGVHLTRAMCLETMGIRLDEVVRYRYKKHGWQGKSLQQIEDEILTELEHLIATKGKRAAGVDHILSFCRSHDLRLALASSSHFRIIHAVLDKLALRDTFEIVHSGELEELGKPHPAIYLTTLSQLGLQHDQAVAIEDSFNGLIAAKAARLKTVVVPEASQREQARFGCADLILPSLSAFTETHWQALLDG